MIFTCLKSGFVRVRENRRMLWVYYGSNLFFGMLLALPLRFVLKGFIGNSQMGERLGGLMDMDFLFEFVTENLASFSAWTGLLLVVPAAYWLFNLFLSGGALATFAQNEKYSPAFFWSHAGLYFGRFVRLALWSIPLLAALFFVQYLENGIRLLIFGRDAYQSITYWGGWIRTGLLGLSLGVLGVVFDYARIHAVQHGETKMRLALWQGLKFTFGNAVPAFGLALVMFVAGGVALLVYNPIADSLNAPNGLIIFLLFMWQQLYMLFRMTVRLMLYSSATNLFQALAAPPEPDAFTQQMDDLGAQGLSFAAN
ncbi:MAG: hypothetical protein ACREOO_10950 [bacterium]